jgi:hypothetical protein
MVFNSKDGGDRRGAWCVVRGAWCVVGSVEIYMKQGPNLNGRHRLLYTAHCAVTALVVSVLKKYSRWCPGTALYRHT